MDKPYAIVGADNRAINFITWNGVNEFDYGQAQGNYLVPLEGIQSYGFGWLWDGAQFINDIVPPVDIPGSITRRQCAIELRERGMITADEALEMTRVGTPPAMVQTVFDQMTPAERIIAETDFAADTYMRSNPLLNSIMAAVGASEADIDQFFISAATR